MNESELELVVASQNSHKLKEISDILSDLPLKITAASEIADLPVIEEDGRTFTANAVKKALVTAKHLKRTTIADDSGLTVDYLNGKPGVYSARYCGYLGTDEQNNEKLLYKMKDVPWEKRDAQFHCVIAVAKPNGEVCTCRGVCHGKIGYRMQGNNGFGYDPIFFLPKYNLTCAEISLDLKNKISHRAQALKQLKKLLSEELVPPSK